MSNMADIKHAKQVFQDHCGAHGCRQGQCETRRNLWLAYMHISEQWRDHSATDTGYR